MVIVLGGPGSDSLAVLVLSLARLALRSPWQSITNVLGSACRALPMPQLSCDAENPTSSASELDRVQSRQAITRFPTVWSAVHLPAWLPPNYPATASSASCTALGRCNAATCLLRGGGKKEKYLSGPRLALDTDGSRYRQQKSFPISRSHRIRQPTVPTDGRPSQGFVLVLVLLGTARTTGRGAIGS